MSVQDQTSTFDTNLLLWMPIVYAVFCEIGPNEFEEFLKNTLENERKQKDNREEIRNDCFAIEWERDMGAKIPFCKLDGELCNLQCRKRFKD